MATANCQSATNSGTGRQIWLRLPPAASMRAILDSGPLIALWNAEPDHLPWVEEVFKRLAGPYYFTEPVLTEVAHLTGRDNLIVKALKSGKFLVPEWLLDQLD